MTGGRGRGGVVTMDASNFPGPLEHPAVWDRETLLERDDWEQSWTGEELEGLGRLQEPVRALERCAPRLSGIQRSLEEGAGATILRGFDPSNHSVEALREIFLRLSERVGTPLSQDAEGTQVFSVCDAGFADSDPRARGPNTREKLSFHTDRCDVIAFLCVQPAMEGGENEVVSSMSVYNEIRRRRPDLLAVLMEPFLYKRHTVDLGNERPYCEQPVFSFWEEHFASVFLRVLIERAYASEDTPAMTALQREALDFAETVAAEPERHVRFRQEPGDLLFLNNWVTWHRRTGFTDDPDPERRRHILRIWLSVPNSRPIHPCFEANYGATAAGALRGGMRAAG